MTNVEVRVSNKRYRRAFYSTFDNRHSTLPYDKVTIMSLRIGAGNQKGRMLRAPKQAATRPTSGRVRAALFNILGDRVPGSSWLDLYAGSGIIGLEALCRGAARATFVEAHPEACRCITDNITALGYDEQAELRCEPVHRFLKSSQPAAERPFDVVFADPPYDDRERRTLEQLLLLCRRDGMMAPHAWLIVEHASAAATPSEGGEWRRARTYVYGDSALTVYHPLPGRAQPSLP